MLTSGRDRSLYDQRHYLAFAGNVFAVCSGQGWMEKEELGASPLIDRKNIPQLVRFQGLFAYVGVA
jgi:hypothetical protein